MRVTKNFIRGIGTLGAVLCITTGLAGIAFGQETPPAPGVPRSAMIPKPVEKTLKNGLRIIVVENTNMPLVTSALIVKSGGEIDADGLAGIADMTGDLLTKGTKTRTAPEIAELVEALGGELNSGAGWDASTVTVNVMSSKISAAMEILADVVRNPTFKDDEIERLREQNLDNLRVAIRQPGTLAGYVAARVVFGDEAYGHPLSGTPESIAAIKRENIVSLHTTYYRPDNAVLVFTGDIKAAEAFKLAERLFGDWTNPTSSRLPALPRSADVPNIGKQRVLVVDMPEAGQAAVVVSRRGITRDSPEYYRGIVSNSVLGGGYSARLNQEIRIKRGLSYGANSSLSSRRVDGYFSASTQTKNESGAEVATLIMTELTRLANEPIPDTELTPRKAVLTGNFGRNLETTGGLATQIANLALYGLSLDEINNYIKNVQAVSGGDVQRFAATRIDAKGANIIVVGNAKMFLEDLRKQFPNIEVISVGDLDLNSASLKKGHAIKASK